MKPYCERLTKIAQAPRDLVVINRQVMSGIIHIADAKQAIADYKLSWSSFVGLFANTPVSVHPAFTTEGDIVLNRNNRMGHVIGLLGMLELVQINIPSVYQNIEARRINAIGAELIPSEVIPPTNMVSAQEGYFTVMGMGDLLRQHGSANRARFERVN